MIKRKLPESWTLRIVGDASVYPAVVPGSVYQDLLRNGTMEDPFYRDNEEKALALMEHDFEYRTSFPAEPDLLACEAVFLKFYGLDTVAEIFLNGRKLGSVCNMHREWEYPVKGILKEENELKVVFFSPTKHIRENYEKDPVQGTEDAMKGFPSLRKAHCMFGWDWGPRLPDAGIWRPVELIGYDAVRLSDVHLFQYHENGRVELSAKTKVLTTGSQKEQSFCEFQKTHPEYHLKLMAEAPDGKQYFSATVSETADERLVIGEAKLWWPNGYGEQPLYRVTLQLCKADEVVEVWEKRIGLRTMTVARQKDAYGEMFAHEVNGVRIFAMGADYIPEDNILSRVHKERTRKLLENCVAANFNCIRVWGGGYYPGDDFYDLCDELGLMVWQDFMFACANYRLTEAFEETILEELKQNVRRLRHHPSLGLWCGNNEMELFAAQGEWGCDDALRADYIKMYEYLFPKLLKQEDPQTFYWPASPSSGGSFDFPADPDRGDVHYWEVWHGSKPFTEYRKFYFRYLSEFGFQSFPSIRTVESFTLPEDRNVFSYVMEKHQRNASANGKIMNYMEQTYLYPNDLDTLIYASQLLQAEAIRYGVEHFRRNRGRCMGTVYWQLNDCWPVASWSSIDYYGRWKALHYYAKRFFAPLMISCEEEGLLTQSMNVNAEPFEVQKSIRLNVVNESRKQREVVVRWSLQSVTGEIKRQEEQKLCVEPLQAVWLDKVELPEAELYWDYVRYQLFEKDGVVSEGSVLFCQPKHFQFEDPKLSVTAKQDEIIVTADGYAKSVEIRNEADDLILSDNFFDLCGGSRRVRVLSGNTEHLSVRSVYNIR